MRKIWTMVVLVALATGTSAQVGASSSSANGHGVSSSDSHSDRLVNHPERIFLSLAALTEFILVAVIATKDRGGRPASP
jgi:hypothetical protein